MPTALRFTSYRSFGLGMLIAACSLSIACGDEPTTAQPKPSGNLADDPAMAIKPVPPLAIPDDPPPHEGNLVDIPLVIEPPDIIIVEVLEALPGRPITGERLVRPDGTISLGFYGDIHVRGLTTNQVKVKIVHHLRKYLIDDVLGLRVFHRDGRPLEPLPKPGTKVSVEMVLPKDDRPFEKPDVEPLMPPGGAPAEVKPPVEPGPAKPAPLQARRTSRASKQPRSDGQRARPSAIKIAGQASQRAEATPAVKAEAKEEEVVSNEAEYIDPVDTVRVFVDFASYNSKIYYVQGDVGSPGRLPFTGKETVLDALNYAGGLIPSAEPTDIHLYRPARGGKPARNYPRRSRGHPEGGSGGELSGIPR